MDREKWKDSINEKRIPAYPCPHCNPGTLYLLRGSLTSKETPGSKAAQNNESWGPDWIEELFVCVLECSNRSCHGLVHVTGLGFYEPTYQGDERVLQPQFLLPAPPIIKIPSDCPKVIGQHLRVAFRLFWPDPAASGNRLRSAIEALLTELKVPRYTLPPVGKKKRRRLPLGVTKRIERLEAKMPVVAERLHAIKWIGHEASHTGNLEKSDVLDAFEILESVLDDLYTKADDRIESIVKQINRGRKPRSKKKKRK